MEGGSSEGIEERVVWGRRGSGVGVGERVG